MNATILIVEDESKIANWIRRYLEREGFQAEIASDGPTGLALARSLNPDLIVLDLMLPGLDGMAVCRTLRQESDVPIIMLTAMGEDYDRIKGKVIGANYYKTKPFELDDLLIMMKDCLSRS